MMIPEKYKNQKTYVLEWSTDNGGIYVVTSKKKNVNRIER